MARVKVGVQHKGKIYYYGGTPGITKIVKGAVKSDVEGFWPVTNFTVGVFWGLGWECYGDFKFVEFMQIKHLGVISATRMSELHPK